MTNGFVDPEDYANKIISGEVEIRKSVTRTAEFSAELQRAGRPGSILAQMMQDRLNLENQLGLQSGERAGSGVSPSQTKPAPTPDNT